MNNLIVRKIKDPERIMEIINTMPNPQIRYKEVSDDFGGEFYFQIEAMNEKGSVFYYFREWMSYEAQEYLDTINAMIKKLQAMPSKYFKADFRTYNDEIA